MRYRGGNLTVNIPPLPKPFIDKLSIREQRIKEYQLRRIRLNRMVDEWYDNEHPYFIKSKPIKRLRSYQFDDTYPHIPDYIFVKWEDDSWDGNIDNGEKTLEREYELGLR